MRPVGLFGAVHDHDARARRDGRCDGVEVEIEGLAVDRHLDGHQAGLEHERLVEEPRREAVDHLVARIADDLQRGRDRGEPAGREVHVVRLEREVEVAAQGFGRGLDRLRVADVVGEPQLVLRDQRLPQDLDVGLGRRVVRVAEREVQHPRLMPSLLVAGQPVEVVEQLERSRAGNGHDAIGGESGIHELFPRGSGSLRDTKVPRIPPMVLRDEARASGLSPMLRTSFVRP